MWDLPGPGIEPMCPALTGGFLTTALPGKSHLQKLSMLNDLNIRAKTLKHLEECIGEKVYDLGFGNGFLDMTPKAQATEEKTDQLDFIKIENFCSLNATLKRG